MIFNSDYIFNKVFVIANEVKQSQFKSRLLRVAKGDPRNDVVVILNVAFQNKHD